MQSNNAPESSKFPIQTEPHTILLYFDFATACFELARKISGESAYIVS
jgi:hypothetical protein